MKPTLLVLAAGLGSRYGGVKQIDAVGPANECLLDYASYDAFKSGYGKVVYIIRKDIEKDFRERLFDRVAAHGDATYVFQSHESLLTPEQIAASTERTKPWGTVHAVLCAKDAVTTPFAVINADDYYGRGALATLGGYLSQVPADSTQHAMVGYRLRNTMSKSGSVSRGICTVSGNAAGATSKAGSAESAPKSGSIPLLTGIEEHLKISFAPDGSIVTEDSAGNQSPLTGDEWVSMNLFGFTPAIFDYFENYWNAFIAENAAHPKKEALLSTAVGAMLAEGRGGLKVFSTDESWFGMTYPEDRPLVKRSVAEKIARGEYPVPLWGD